MDACIQKYSEYFIMICLLSSTQSITQYPPHNSSLKKLVAPPGRLTIALAAMAYRKLTSIVLVFSLLLIPAFTSACGPCMPKTPAYPTCPRDTLKLGACVDLLGLVNIVVGTPASSECCALLEGLADLEVALCLCTAIKANVLGIKLSVPVALSLLVNVCGKSIPPGFQCA
uniref:Bifunctional inhibitor/plant lipid transfer protein/seed storage helical domain-containing protein n=1 Tax=Rhizophora mucronata TaxID=61149 RepID=A0A2P2MXE9_RHIMU